jgi:hypothetical protein
MAKVTKRAPVKYADKSAGQPELLPVFDVIKELVSVYARGSFLLKRMHLATMSYTMTGLWNYRENTIRR